MRAAFIVMSLALSACAVTQGAGDTASAPFASPPAPAAVAAPREQYPAAVDLPAGTYRLDPRHASVLFRIRHMELSWFTARFDTVDATLELDPSDPTHSHLNASVGSGSVNTNVLNAQGERGFDRQIGRALGSEAAERITFASTAIERTGRNTARVTGDLTMNGQTHPATLDVTFDGGRADPLRGGNMVLGFSAHGTITRSVWGVNNWSAFVGDTVQIVIEAELTHA